MRKITTPKIVQPAGVSRWWLVWLLLGMMVSALGWIAFDYGKVWGGYSAGRSGSTIARLNETIVALEKERNGLRQKLAVAERARQVDAQATDIARQNLADLQRKNRELGKDLELLRKLIKDDAGGVLRIKDFVLNAAAHQREFAYRFILTQLKSDSGLSEGSIQISVSGVLDGYAKTLSLAELTAGKEDRHKMRFRHFQDISGTLMLPKGFSPQSIRVEIDPASKKLAPLSEVFDWRLPPKSDARGAFLESF
jgi:predicted phage tail protein